MPRWRPVERAGSLLRALSGRAAGRTTPAATKGARWSLVPRLSVLVLGVGLAALAIQILVLRLWTQPLFEDHAQSLAAQVRSIHAALRQTPQERRDALADALTRGSVELARAEPDVPGELPPPVPQAAADTVRPAAAATAPQTPFAGRLAQVLGAVKLHDGRFGRLIFELPVDGQTWWLTLRAPASPQLLLDTVLLWLALLAVASGLTTVLGLRWIARPLRRLAGQIALQRGGRLQPIVPDPSASDEVRTLVHAFNELVHANTMAASLRQQLLAGVSHDLRTPLARLRLRIETQCEPPLSDALETDLLALQHIVDQFLAYVQGDAAPRMGPKRPVVELMAEVADGYAAQGQPVDAAWPGGAVLDVMADRSAAVEDTGGVAALAAALEGPELALRRLLENLVNNALAHGRPPVTLQLWRAPDGGWRLAVCDEGRGMSRDEFEDARRPFVRLRGTRHELGHCGLGLAIVDQIAQHLGATLEVRPAHADRPFAIVVAWPATAQGTLSAEPTTGAADGTA